MLINEQIKKFQILFSLVVILSVIIVSSATAEPESKIESQEKVLASKIKINSTNFPNKIFRNWVKENCDTNGDGKLDSKEIKARTEINVSGGITRLDGD